MNGSVPLSCGLPFVSDILKLNEEYIAVVETECNWKPSASWVAWWTRPKHLKMLCKPFKDMSDFDWERAPKDTNGVERMNRFSKTRGNIPSLYVAMV